MWSPDFVSRLQAAATRRCIPLAGEEKEKPEVERERHQTAGMYHAFFGAQGW